MNRFLKHIKWIFYWCFLTLSSINLAAQNLTNDTLPVSVILQLIPTNSQQKLPQNFKNTYRFASPESVPIFLDNLIDSLHQTAFLTASIDSLNEKDTTYLAYLFLGKAYNSFTIKNGNIDKAALKRTGTDRLLTKNLTYQQLQFIQEELLKYAENNGFPFATIQLKEIALMDSIISGKLFWQTGKAIRLSALKNEGDARLSTNYLANYLGLQKGDLYQKEKIIASSQRIQELPFVKETRSPSVNFKGDEATINLFLANKKANRFDFLIGVLPNNAETGKVLITGNIDAEFQNQFGKGEKLRFKFEQLRPETQQLEIATSYPYIGNTPLGVDFEFGLYKRDSTYRDLIWNIGLQYLFEGNNYLKAFSKNTASTLLSINEAAIIRNQQLPQNLDIKNASFGLGYHFEKLDYRFNPRSGWLLDLKGSAGFKEIKKNAKISGLQSEVNPAFNFSTLYDNLDLMTFQYQLEGRIDKYFSIQKRGVLKTSVQGATTLSETPILKNEQFRIGGNYLLRGFDEESIFATSYAIGTLEYRYLIGQNSYFFLFGDAAYVSNKTMDTDFTNRPIGIGAGMTFETKAGLFGISYALGKLENTAFEFRTAKVHFGFVSLF